MFFSDLLRTTCALGKTRQLIRFIRRTQAWGELKPWLIWKVAPTKQPLRCEANYQRKIYYSIVLTEAHFTTTVTTNNPVKHNLPGIDSSNLQWNFLARILICSLDSIKFLMFLFQFLRRLVYIVPLSCCVAPFFGFLSITLEHTIIHRSLF